MKTWAIALSGGGAAIAVAAVVGYRNAAKVKKSVVDAVAGANQATKAKVDAAKTKAALKAAVDEAAPPAPDDIKAAAAAGDTAAITGSSWYTGQVQLHLTGYWPFTAKSGETGMEGGVHDRVGKPLHTVEDFLAGKSDHVSLSGDDSAFPYGQAITLPWTGGQTIKGRVTDTGGSFRGTKKKYRVIGEEPIDVCVYSSRTPVPSSSVTATIVKGDNWKDQTAKTVADVDVSRLKGQIVTVGALEMLGAV